jgi:hypothetical protein
MPRTAIPVADPVGPFPTLPVAADSLDVAGTAADTVNKNEVAFGNHNRLLVTWVNTGASARTVTIASALDTYKRSGDVTTYSTGAGEFAAFLVERNGWLQSDGKLYLEANNAEVIFRVYGL